MEQAGNGAATAVTDKVKSVEQSAKYGLSVLSEPKSYQQIYRIYRFYKTVLLKKKRCLFNIFADSGCTSYFSVRFNEKTDAL